MANSIHVATLLLSMPMYTYSKEYQMCVAPGLYVKKILQDYLTMCSCIIKNVYSYYNHLKSHTNDKL